MSRGECAHIIFMFVKMLWLLTTIIVLICYAIGKSILPLWRRHLQLRKDYQNITPLPISRIPFVGHIRHLNLEPHLGLQLACKLSKECQDQNKGLFCLWYSIWPMVLICSGRGLEVSILHLFFTTQLMSSLEIDIH